MKWIIRCNIGGVFLLPFCQCLLILFLHFNFEGYSLPLYIRYWLLSQLVSLFDCGMIWEMLGMLNALHCWDLVSLIPEAITYWHNLWLARAVRQDMYAFWILKTLFGLLVPQGTAQHPASTISLSLESTGSMLTSLKPLLGLRHGKS